VDGGGLHRGGDLTQGIEEYMGTGVTSVKTGFVPKGFPSTSYPNGEVMATGFGMRGRTKG